MKKVLEKDSKELDEKEKKRSFGDFMFRRLPSRQSNEENLQQKDSKLEIDIETKKSPNHFKTQKLNWLKSISGNYFMEIGLDGCNMAFLSKRKRK